MINDYEKAGRVGSEYNIVNDCEEGRVKGKGSRKCAVRKGSEGKREIHVLTATVTTSDK